MGEGGWMDGWIYLTLVGDVMEVGCLVGCPGIDEHTHLPGARCPESTDGNGVFQKAQVQLCYYICGSCQRGLGISNQQPAPPQLATEDRRQPNSADQTNRAGRHQGQAGSRCTSAQCFLTAAVGAQWVRARWREHLGNSRVCFGSDVETHGRRRGWLWVVRESRLPKSWTLQARSASRGPGGQVDVTDSTAGAGRGLDEDGLQAQAFVPSWPVLGLGHPHPILRAVLLSAPPWQGAT